MSGLSGLLEEERAGRIAAIVLVMVARRPFWTPIGRQGEGLEDFRGCKSLQTLVGPPGFEPGTSCTPSKRASQAAPRPEAYSLTHVQLAAD